MRIVAVDKTVAMRKRAGTSIIDLHGRTVIPGLIGSHMRATRATRSFVGDDPPGWVKGNAPPDAMEAVKMALAAGRPMRELHRRLMLFRSKHMAIWSLFLTRLKIISFRACCPVSSVLSGWVDRTRRPKDRGNG